MDRSSTLRHPGTRHLAVTVVLTLTSLSGAACSDDGSGESDVTTSSSTGSSTTTVMPTTGTSAGSSSTTDGSTGPDGSSTTTGGVTSLTQRCDNPGGFSISYPDGWFTNTDPLPDPCVWFAPTAIETPLEATDSLLASVTVRVQDGARFEDVSEPQVMFEEIVSSEPLTIQGRRAVRVESVATGEGLLNEGTRITAYVIELEPAAGTPRVITATAFECCNVGFVESVTVLDEMVTTLEIAG